MTPLDRPAERDLRKRGNAEGRAGLRHGLGKQELFTADYADWADKGIGVQGIYPRYPRNLRSKVRGLPGTVLRPALLSAPCDDGSNHLDFDSRPGLVVLKRETKPRG